MKRAVSPEYEVVADELREEGREEGRQVLKREVLTMKYSERIERLLDMYPEYRVVADEIIEEGREEGFEEVRAKLRAQGSKEMKAIARKLYQYGVDPEIIEKCTGLDAENLDKLAKEQEQKKGQSEGLR